MSLISHRVNRISWDDHNMLKAIVASWRSPDPNTQVGAYICTTKNVPLGSGYNGPPRGISPVSIPWTREGEPILTKYPYIVHAEINAIENAATSIVGSTLYVTLHPCNECVKGIIQAGIKKIVYLDDPYMSLWQTKAAKWMLDQVDIVRVQHKWDSQSVLEHLQKLQSLISSTK